MIASILLYAAVASVAPDADAGGPLDDLTVLEAVAEGAFADDAEALDLADAGTSGATDLAMNTPMDDWWRRGAWSREASGEVLAARKDKLRSEKGRFGLPRDGFVDVPGPRGAGGQIAADLLTAGTESETPTETTAEADPSGAARTGNASPPSATANGAAAIPSSAGSQPIGKSAAYEPAMRMSFANPGEDDEAASAAEGEALATPVPPSLLLFASGIGLFGLSRRKAA